MRCFDPAARIVPSFVRLVLTTTGAADFAAVELVADVDEARVVLLAGGEAAALELLLLPEPHAASSKAATIDAAAPNLNLVARTSDPPDFLGFIG